MRKELYLVLAAIVLYLAAYNFYEVLPYFEVFGVERKPFYYVGALGLTMLALALYLALDKHPITFIFVAFTLNNLADELVFNPLVSQYSEYAFAGLAIIYTIHYYNKLRVYEKDAKT